MMGIHRLTVLIAARIPPTHSALESRFNEVSLASPAGSSSDVAGEGADGLKAALGQVRAENEQLIGRMRELLGRHKALQKTAGELKAAGEEAQRCVLGAGVRSTPLSWVCVCAWKWAHRVVPFRRRRRIAALEATTTQLPSSTAGDAGAGTTGTDTEAEVARLRAENAKLVEKMREILVKYKSMQEQLTISSAGGGGGGAAGGGGGGGGEGAAAAAGAAGPSENEQKLVGKLKEIVGKYKELQTLSKVRLGLVVGWCVDRSIDQSITLTTSLYTTTNDTNKRAPKQALQEKNKWLEETQREVAAALEAKSAALGGVEAEAHALK